MPHNDYNDPELDYPRLEARIQKTDGDAYWIQIWLWKEPGKREIVLNRKRAGSYPDALEIIKVAARETNADFGVDDIIVD